MSRSTSSRSTSSRSAMTRFVGYTLAVIGAVLAVVAAAAAYLAITFDPNDYKTEVVDLVRSNTQRTLALQGDIKLSFWPDLGADLGAMSLSERDSDARFVSARAVRASLAVLPLLQGRLVVRKVELEGVDASIRRDANGVFNFADLLSANEQPSEKIDFDVAYVAVRDGRLRYADALTGMALDASDIRLTTGRLRERTPSDIALTATLRGKQPALALRVDAGGRVMFDSAAKEVEVQGLKLAVDGDALGLKAIALTAAGDIDVAQAQRRLALGRFSVHVAATQGGRRLTAQLKAPQVSIRPGDLRGDSAQLAFTAEDATQRVTGTATLPAFSVAGNALKTGALDLQLDMTRGDEAAHLRASAPLTATLGADGLPTVLRSPGLKASLSGKLAGSSLDAELASPLALNIAGGRLEMPALVVRLDARSAGIDFDADLRTPLEVQFAGPSLRLAGFSVVAGAKGKDLPGGGARTRLSGTLDAALGTQTARLALKGDVDGQTLDGVVEAANWGALPQVRFDLRTGRLDLDRYLPPAAAAQAAPDAPREPDLTVLRTVDVAGRLQAQGIKARGISAEAVDATVAVGGGRAALAAFAARVFGGSASGNLRIDASQTMPQLVVQTQASQIDIAALLRAFSTVDNLSGRGNVNLDLTARGISMDAIAGSLNGRGDVVLSDGAVKGLDIGGTLREARSTVRQLTGKRDYSGSSQARTDFAEMRASFTAREGRLDNRDLEMKSPLLRVNGAGQIDLAKRGIDYTVKATLVASSQGQGGKTREQLSGLTVPVKVFGTLDKPGYSIDFAGMVTDQAVQQLQRAVQDPAGAKDAARDLVRDRKKQVRDLKNLLGR